MPTIDRPGGVSATQSGWQTWTPRGFVGRLFAVVGRYAPPPATLAPPSSWGLADHLNRLFRASASAIHTTSRDFVFRYRSAEHWIDAFRNWFGPVHAAFAGLPAEAQICLEQDLIDLIDDFNCSGDSTVVVPGEYVQAVIVKK